MIWWPAQNWGQINAPNHKKSLNRLLNKFRQKGTVQDLRKRRPSASEGVEEVTNEEMVLYWVGPALVDRPTQLFYIWIFIC